MAVYFAGYGVLRGNFAGYFTGYFADTGYFAGYGDFAGYGILRGIRDTFQGYFRWERDTQRDTSNNLGILKRILRAHGGIHGILRNTRFR